MHAINYFFFKNFKSYKLFWGWLSGVSFIVILLFNNILAFAQENYNNNNYNAVFTGKGIYQNPYLINSYDDLCKLRDLCNDGNNFANVFFEQTKNIMMPDLNWEPIGFESEFSGIYNGNGHYINNLNADNEYTSGLFGRLSGTVANLGIEGGRIVSENCGSIAGLICSEDALIINCYSKANLSGTFVGGIAGYAKENGTLACVFDATSIEGEYAGGAIGVGKFSKLYSCFSENSIISGDGCDDYTSSYVKIKFSNMSNKSFDKINIKQGIAQYLYAEKYHLFLKQINFSIKKELFFSNERFWIVFLGILNSYLLPVILFVVISVYAYTIIKRRKEEYWRKEKQRIKTLAFIFFVISLFIDSALLKNIQYLNVGKIIFVIECNFILISCLWLWIKNEKTLERRNIIDPIIFVMIIIMSLELLQFDILSYYDSSLYYGSFVKAIDNFRLDLFSYIGSFICWKSIHGLALFLAPVEFFVQGQCIGVHVGNVIITLITLFFLNRLLKKLFYNITSFQSALLCFCYVVFPYEIGMFTYFSTDFQLAFFAIWLMYAVYEKNDLLILFSGFLLTFTKDTGGFFYVIFLILFVTIEIVSENGYKRFLTALFKWLKVKRVVLWIIPTICYLVLYKFGAYFSTQVFVGATGEDIWGLKTGEALSNTILQSFVFGFRWLIIIISIITILVHKIKKNKSYSITREGKLFIYTSILTNTFIIIMLISLRGLTESPRYTAILNSVYILGLAYVSQELFQKNRLKYIFLMISCIIFTIQTYWTIDPALFLNGYYIETGKKRIYKYTVREEERPEINLGIGYGVGEVLTDGFTVNYEHTFYSDLYQKILLEINPSQDVNFYVLDLCDYEIQICGSYNFFSQDIDIRNSKRAYKVYWDTKAKKRTFKRNSDCIQMYETSILTSQLEDSNVKDILPKEFYLLAVARVNESKAIDYLERMEYICDEKKVFSNMYGELSVIHVTGRLN